MNFIKPFRPSPKHQAEQFLRAHGIHYNDFITGDHAADILAKALLSFTDYQMHVCMIDLMNEAKSLTTPWLPQGIFYPVRNENDGPHILTAKDGSSSYCGGSGKCKWCDKKTSDDFKYKMPWEGDRERI